MELDDKNQWLRNIRRIKSPNCDNRPENTEIRLLVIHGISLPPGQYGGEFIDQLFTNSLDPEEHAYFQEIKDLRVSSHLLIDRKGRMTQYVPFDKRAWHAGASEFDNCPNCNDYSIGIELEGVDDAPYELIQYSRLLEATNVIMSVWTEVTRERIVGHCDIAPGRKTDPGPGFDWDYFYKCLD